MLNETTPRHLILPILSGFLSFLCFPAADQGYLAWVALVPLTVYLSRGTGVGPAAFGGFVSGAVQNAGLLLWVPQVMSRYGGIPKAGSWGIYALLVGLQASFPAAACALAGFCIRRKGRAFLLILPFAWVSTELLECHFPFGGFPWLLMGYSQTNHLRLIQFADVSGVLGMSFLVLWVNASLGWMLVNRPVRWACLSPLLLALAMLTAAFVYGAKQLELWTTIRPGYTAALLQENISADDTPGVMNWKFLEGYLKLSERLTPGRTDLLVLPESPSPLSYQYDERYRAAIGGLARRFPLGLIFNNIAFEEVNGASRYFNSAYFVGSDGVESGRYDKVHLVPFGEYVPLKRLFFFIESISRDVGDFYPGSRIRTVPVGGHPVGAIICYEAVFPDLVRRTTAGGGQLIVNLSNDGWYGDSAAPYQHLAMSRWRAIENRRYFLRATNSGISAIIEPSGRIQSATQLFREDVCSGRFAFIETSTVYARAGDLFATLCVIIMSVLILYCLVASSVRGDPASAGSNRVAAGQ